MTEGTILGRKLTMLRKENGLTQEELGRVLGVVKSTISSYEKGINCPNDEIKVKICKYFGVSLDFLLGLSSEAPIEAKSSAFSERLRTARKERGLTQEELGTMLGVAKTSIANYETNYCTPTYENLVSIAKALDVSIDYLAGISGVFPNKANHEQFSIRLRNTRQRRAHSRKYLAEAVNITVSAISNYENAISTPNYGTLISIAKTLNVSTDYLLGISDFESREDEVTLLALRKSLDESKTWGIAMRELAENLLKIDDPETKALLSDSLSDTINGLTKMVQLLGGAI